MAPIISLKKADQKKVVKKTKRITKQVQTGKTKQQPRVPRGLIYLGHIPHGFYEEEMRQYFKQFGRVTNLKLCRSRNTGNSKGYGFIEFQNEEVAKIAAETMNNYIMFKRRLVAQFIPPEKRPPHIFHSKQSMPGDYSRLRKRNMINASKNKDISEEAHLAQCKSRAKRLAARIKLINELGVAYNLQPVDVPENLQLE